MKILMTAAASPVHAANAGLFVSRGFGIHPTRVIDSHELLYVHSGVLGIREEQHCFEVKSGQTLILFPDREHGGTLAYPRDLSFYWVHFRLAEAHDASPVLRLPQISTVARPDRLVELFRLFLDDQESGRGDSAVADGLVHLMLAEAAQPAPAFIDAPFPGAALASRADRYLREHFHEPIGTAHVARILHCNPDYLGRVYRKAYGRTITDSIHECRLRLARRLLMDSGLNINEIAWECGYDQPGYFRRVFGKHAGMSPRSYRRLHARVHYNTD
ncbi:MAG: helix-turn-helix transcriptional regulator [Planctomycetes bacterium]|nr:helix-turn-helix transcriptional regulator [Planctomycetota bacterium]